MKKQPRIGRLFQTAEYYDVRAACLGSKGSRGGDSAKWGGFRSCSSSQALRDPTFPSEIGREKTTSFVGARWAAACSMNWSEWFMRKNPAPFMFGDDCCGPAADLRCFQDVADEDQHNVSMLARLTERMALSGLRVIACDIPNFVSKLWRVGLQLRF